MLEKNGKLADEKAKEFCSDITLKRYLRGYKQNVKTAYDKICNTLTWRSENNAQQVICTACATNPKSHSFRPVGFCKEGRPVFFSSIAGVEQRDPDDVIDHFIYYFERCFELIDSHQYVWIADLSQFSTSDLTPSVAQQAITLFIQHYPERLGKLVIIDSPLIFLGLWKLVKSWLEPESQNKISFVRYKEKDKLFRELFHDNVVQRLNDDLETVRDPTKLASIQGWNTPPLPPSRSPKRKLVSVE